MKKLLSLLSVLTISGTAVPTIIAASPYQKEKDLNSKINYLQKYKRSNNKPHIITVYDDNKLKTNEAKIIINGEYDTFFAEGLVLNNKVYFGSTNNGRVYEYDPQTNEEKIFITADSSIIKPQAEFLSPGVILNNKLYFASRNGKVYEYDPGTEQQKIVITADYGSQFNYYCIVTLNNKIYAQVLGMQECIYEYVPATGQQQKTTVGSDWIWNFNVVLNNKLYFVTNNNHVYGINEYNYETQEQKLLFESTKYINSRIVILNNKVYFQTVAPGEGLINEYDLLTKEIIKISSSSQSLNFNGNALKNKVYFNISDNYIYQYDPETKELNKIIDDDKSRFLSSGIVLNNNLYFGNDGGKVYEYNPETNEAKIVTILDGTIDSTGVALNNKLYFGTSNHVYEYDPVTNELLEKWYEFLEHDKLKIKFNFNTVNEIKNLLLNNKKLEFINKLKVIINNIPKSGHSGAGGSITDDDVNVIAIFIWEHYSYFNEKRLSLNNNKSIIIETNTIGYFDNTNSNNSIYIN